MPSAMEILDSLTAPGELFTAEGDGVLRCHACAHRCRIRPRRRGICQVRFNRDGELRVPFGYVAALQVDPIEKKPFNHFLPGSDALTFGMLGCDLHCDFCQNWLSSQEYCNPAVGLAGASIRRITPEQIVEHALQNQVQVVVSSYNEPLITSEWAVSIFRLAKQAGFHCAYVSNGYATAEVLDYLRPYLTGFKIDLKTMQDRHYRSLGGVLQNVLDAIRMAHERGLWVEVVTLVIPGFNDSPDELWDAARYLVSVSPDIPWHLTAFHPDYKMTDPPPTPVDTLRKAAEIGQEAGLRFVYAGNLPGRVGSLEDTLCPACQTLLIHRRGFSVIEYHIAAAGNCPKCGSAIPGVWQQPPDQAQRGGWRMPRRLR